MVPIKDSGKIKHYDRVLSNPPFSQNYSRGNDDNPMEFPERFHYGFCPTTGKKADLMFAQHMLYVLKPDGIMVTVMPHGVLFRGGEEKKVRPPLIRLTKKEIVTLGVKVLGDRFQEILELTHTCYAGTKGGCGTCHACLLRDRGFLNAGVVDPSGNFGNLNPTR